MLQDIVCFRATLFRFNPAGSVVNHDVMLSHVSPGYYSRAADTRVSDAHTILLSSSNQIDKPLHAINGLGLLDIFMLYSYRISSASEWHCSLGHATSVVEMNSLKFLVEVRRLKFKYTLWLASPHHGFLCFGQSSPNWLTKHAINDVLASCWKQGTRRTMVWLPLLLVVGMSGPTIENARTQSERGYIQ